MVINILKNMKEDKSKDNKIIYPKINLNMAKKDKMKMKFNIIFSKRKKF